MESNTGGNVSKKAVQSKTSALPSTQTSQPKLIDKKRKRDKKGKEVMDERRKSPSKEVKAQRGGKHAKAVQTKSYIEGAITTRRSD